MKTSAALILLLCLGCDASPSSSPDAGLDVSELGDACDRSRSDFCARGLGTCVADVCRQQCTNNYPRCPTSTHEAHEDLGSGMQCFCVP